jgi:hypothetical protein
VESKLAGKDKKFSGDIPTRKILARIRFRVSETVGLA